jgi:dTDP-4-dehydrorhamnose reductase
MRLLICGAGGQLGQHLASRFSSRHDVRAFDRRALDVTDPRAVDAAARGVDAVVNCAAYTDVDGAERDPIAAISANALGPRVLARVAAEHGAALVHFSTDFVFDGREDVIHTEDSPANPTSVYGASKWLGERFAEDVTRHFVLRVESLFGGPHGKSSVDRMLAQLTRGETVRAFQDRTVSPSYVDDVASAVEFLLASDAAPGLYHCVNTGVTTWVDVAQEIARLAGVTDARIEPVRWADATLLARRPQFAALANDKLRAAGFDMPAWTDALARWIARAR